MVASVDSVESGPSEGTLDPAEIDFDVGNCEK